MSIRQLIPVLWLISILLTITGCRPLDVDGDIPRCLREELRDAQGPAALWEWRVDGETYYYLRAQCCDQLNVLVDTDCNRICAPDGGFGGVGDGMCPAFTTEIIQKQIWSREE